MIFLPLEPYTLAVLSKKVINIIKRVYHAIRARGET
jgi:hypothetical protein